MNNIRKILFLFMAVTMVACSKVPISGRRQFNVVPGNMLSSLSLTSYQQFLTENPPVASNNEQAQQIRNVGQKIAAAVETYLRDNGKADKIKSFAWEFNLVDSPDVNAWCMPGGKVVFYTGILPIAKDESGIAVVMGHEISHALANHGGERMSQQLAVLLGGVSLEVALQKEPGLTKDIFNMVYGVGSQLGMLAYSRTHEYEADKLGMVFMAMAGYDPARAIEFWEQMAAISGQRPMEFFSTHPANEKRIKALQDFLPEANKYYGKNTNNNNMNSPKQIPLN